MQVGSVDIEIHRLFLVGVGGMASMTVVVIMVMVMLVIMIVVMVVIVVMAVVVIMVMMVMTVSMVVIVTTITLATQVVVAFSAVKNLHLDQIENERNDCNNEHSSASHLWFFKEPECRLDEKPDSHDPDGGDRDHGTNYLCTVPAVSQMVIRALLAEPQCEDGHSKTDDV